jgi:hypothetical protein
VGLAVVGGLLVLLCLAGSAYGKARSTTMVSYVSAGAPVKGAQVRVVGPSGRQLKLLRATRTDANGFVTLVFRGRPQMVRVIARGGVAKHQRVVGSLRAIVRHPGLKHDAYVNPVSTVVDAYAALNPGRSLAFAKRKAEHLLRLRPGELAGDGLLDETPFFNGLRFLRDARAHGGVQRYIKHLINQDQPVSFKGAGGALELPTGIFKYVKLLGMAGDGVGAIFTVGSIAYSLFGLGIESDEQKALDAIKVMQEQLGHIQESISALRAELASGIDVLGDQVDEATYNTAVAKLQDLIGTVSTAQDDFRDYVDNELSSQPDARVRDVKYKELELLMPLIESHFTDSADLFYDALLPNRFTPVIPAYRYLGKILLSRSAHFMTTEDSAQLENFAGYVLQYQALAFNLIVRWENQEGAPTEPGGTARPPNTVLKKAIKLYLGFDKPEQMSAWLENWDAKKQQDRNALPDVPASGDFHDEMTYLETISPVPANTIIEADGPNNVQGNMWSTKPVQIELGRTIHDVPPETGMGCANQYAPPAHVSFTGTAGWCQYMEVGWTTMENDLFSAQTALKGVGPTDKPGPNGPITPWDRAALPETQGLLARLNGIAPDSRDSIMKIQDRYLLANFASGDGFKVLSSKYWATPHGDYCPPAQADCRGVQVTWVDGVQVATVNAKGATATCSFGVGYHQGSTCPKDLYVLFRRPTAIGETYWPAQP